MAPMVPMKTAANTAASMYEFILQTLTHRPKRPPVLRRCTSPLKRFQVHGCGITFVLGQTVAGVLLLQHLHFPVAGDLGEDIRGADRLYPGIALHHRLGGPAPIRATVAVY